jgi:hypothetical protein
VVDSLQVTGSLEVGTGDSTGYFDIFFIRPGSHAREVPLDESQTLAWTIADTSLVSLETPPSVDGHTHQHFEFLLRGRKPGRTTVMLRLRHEDHDDYVSPAIAVTVR